MGTPQRSLTARLKECVLAIEAWELTIVLALQRSGSTKTKAWEVLNGLYDLQDRAASIRREMEEEGQNG